MAPRWVIGDTVHLENSFYNDGTLTDPGSVTLTVTDPSGTPTSYTYASAAVVKDSTGVYYRNVVVNAAGKWSWQWTSTDPAPDVVAGTFTVLPAALDALDVLTSDEAKAILKIDQSDETEAARLASAVTAVSRRLDDVCGPIVKRAVTESHTGICGDLWVDLMPIYSTPGITLTEYDASGSPTVLSPEDFDTKPTNGYRLERRSGLGGGYTGKICRRSGSGAGRFGSVVIDYTAGRYADTGTVDPVFKEAGAVILINLWTQVLAQPAVTGDLDLPYYRFPKAAVVAAARDLLPETEFMSTPVVA